MVVKSREEILRENKGLISNITKGASFIDEDGEVKRFGQRYVVLSLRYFPFRFLEETKRLTGSASTTIVYMVGKRCGRDIYEKHVKTVNDKTTAVKLCSAEMWHLGWGIIYLDVEDNKAIVYNSFEADSFLSNRQNRIKPTCHFLRGVIAGIWSSYYGKNCYGDEKLCGVTGDAYCEIVIRFTD